MLYYSGRKKQKNGRFCSHTLPHPPTLFKGIGAVVYEVSMNFKMGAKFGDRISVSTTTTMESDYRVLFTHEVRRLDSIQSAAAAGGDGSVASQ